MLKGIELAQKNGYTNLEGQELLGPEENEFSSKLEFKSQKLQKRYRGLKSVLSQLKSRKVVIGLFLATLVIFGGLLMTQST